MRKVVKQIFTKANFFKHRPHEWFTGNYRTFEEARALCSGYDAPAILEKVKSALLKVKNGEAVYERDSVLFDEVQYSLPLLAFLQYAASVANNSLNILDFGGSLGSTFFQNRKFLTQFRNLEWNIVEQPHFVNCGQEYFADKHLHFFTTIAECVAKKKTNVILLSSVLPYLPQPYDLIAEILRYGFEIVIIDRTPFFTDDDPDRITIEHVPAEIYRAEYPAWFFNRNKLIQTLAPRYSLFESLPANDKLELSGAKVEYLAMMFIRK
jgi:putative methyltransferase (TIGR04325 family)